MRDEPAQRSALLERVARADARRLLSVAKNEGLGAEDALDAVQDSFALAMKLPRLAIGTDGEARALLSTLVKNRARNARRRHHRARAHDGIDELTATHASAEDRAALAEESARLQTCFAKLEARARRVVALRVLEEVSNTDAAAELGLAPGHVAVLLHRAREELRRCVG